MAATPSEPEGDDAVRLAAARWTVRRDRGLSSAEAIEFELWLASDPRHADAMRRCGAAWSLLDRTPESTAQRELAGVTRRRRRWRWVTVASLAAAAGVALLSLVPGRKPDPWEKPGLVAVGPREVTLADGTLVRLNAGGEVREDFDAQERRVRLTRGEAHFSVVRQASRPFVVVAGALRARAVGTAFNVNFRPSGVEVLVTEGRVALLVEGAGSAVVARNGTGREGGAPGDRGFAPIGEVKAGERAIVPPPSGGADAAAAPVAVERVDAAEMARSLAWQDAFVRLGGARLAEIAAEFERRTGHRVVLVDPELAQVRLGGRLRADDAAGFAQLLTAMLEVEAEVRADGTIVLRKKR